MTVINYFCNLSDMIVLIKMIISFDFVSKIIIRLVYFSKLKFIKYKIFVLYLTFIIY